MSYLKQIPADCTFNQNRFTSLLALPGPYYSLDLTNATDRMPMWLQKAIMVHFLGRKKAEAWAQLLVGREYREPKGTHIRYGCGQPMGAYSS